MFDQRPDERGAAFGSLTNLLLFMIRPEADAARRIAHITEGVRKKHALTARPYPAERLHITLSHIGDFPALPYNTLDAAIAAASTLVMPSFTVAFNVVSSFNGSDRHPLVLRGDDGVAGVLKLQGILGSAMQRVGLVGARHHFTPHVTLLRDARSIDEERIEEVIWTVREFVLVQSLLGLSRYVPLARWTLGG